MDDQQQWIALSRRRLIGSAVMVCTGTERLLATSASKPSDKDLDPVFRQIIRSFLPDDAQTFPLDVEAVLAKMKRMLAAFSEDARRTLEVLVTVFDKAAYLHRFRFRSFQQLDRSQAVAYARSWEQGFLLQQKVIKALKSLVFTAYWSLPSSWPAIGYRGPVTDLNAINALGPAPLPSA